MKFRLLFALTLVSAALMACDKTDGGASSSDPGSGTGTGGDPGTGETTVRLDKAGSANCYIISKPGDYCFRALQGNSTDLISGVKTVAVLWESFGTATKPSVGSVITNCTVTTTGTDAPMIKFSTPSKLNNGNAVIAAKDGSGKILWSWHIWVCDGYDPIDTAQEYYNKAGTYMDRNLGATAAIPGYAGTLGLLYQWGRKDPFLGSSSINSSTVAASTGTWPDAVECAEGINVQYAIEHPMTFIASYISGTKNDWNYESVASSWLWNSQKRAQDPCPPGWRVPDGWNDSPWGKALDGMALVINFDEVSRGLHFGGAIGNGTIWYPAAGFLSGKRVLGLTGYQGAFWTCTTSNFASYNMALFNSDAGSMNLKYDPYAASSRSYGLSVRCKKE